MVDAAGTRTLARVTQDRWSNPRVLEPGRELSGTSGHFMNLDMGASRSGSWSTPRSHGPWPESPGTAGGPHRTYDQDRCYPGELVDPAVPRTRDESTRIAGRYHGSSTLARVSQDSWSKKRAIGHGTDSPRTAGRPRGISGTGPSHLGVLVDSAGHRPERELPGMLINTAGPRTLARVAPFRRSTPRGLGHEDQSSGTAGGHLRPLDTDTSRLGQMFDPTGHGTRTRVT